MDSFPSVMQIYPNNGIIHRTNDVVNNNNNDNYVGLRISTNGEFGGAIDLTNSCVYGYTSNNNISRDENNIHDKKTASFQASFPTFNDKTSEQPDILFGAPKEIMSGSQNMGNDLGVDITIQFDNQQVYLLLLTIPLFKHKICNTLYINKINFFSMINAGFKF